MSFKKLQIPGNKKVVVDGVEFRTPIPYAYPDTCLLDDTKVIILYMETGSPPEGIYLSNSNIFAFNKMGQVIWRVEPFAPDGGGALQVFSYYQLRADDRGQIIAVGGRGDVVTLNTENGKILYRHPSSGRAW